MKELFNNNQSQAVLSKFRHKIDGLAPSEDFEKQRNSLIRLVIGSMEAKPEQWDQTCQINIDWIGDHFISRLSDEEKELTKDRLDEICAMCFRFIFELYLSIKNDLSMEFEAAKRFVFNNLNLFEHDARQQIEHAIRDMPINIFKAIANSDAIKSIKNFNSISEKAEKLKNDWDTDLEAKEKRVNQLKESLSEYENGFNFVGLYQGFDDLSDAKTSEKNNIVFWLRILPIIIFSPIIVELWVIYSHIENLDAVKTGILVSILPTLSLVGISIYYFRVLLFNYKSVKSQLLQIELRKTLCRFIQNYSDYSTEIKEKDASSLEKFENVIFSGIVSDEGSLPSTYDGIEQLTKLLRSFRS